MKEEFRQEYEKIHASGELKERTKQLMRESLLSETAQEGILPKNKKKSKGKRAAVIGTMALMAAALGIVLYSFSGRDGFYVTPISEDAYYAQIEVADGMIYFAERGQSLEITPNASKTELGQDETTEKDETEQNGGAVTEVGDNGFIRVKESAGSLPEAKEGEYSYVAGEKLLVTAAMGEKPVYTAYLARDGILYTVVGDGVSQKQFLDYIYKNFLKK